MARQAAKTKKIKTTVHHRESDEAFFLKIVMYLLVSSLWVRIDTGDGTVIPLPVGAVVAVFFALHDHFQIDRKIELALILVAMFISFWLPIGLFITL